MTNSEFLAWTSKNREHWPSFAELAWKAIEKFQRKGEGTPRLNATTILEASWYRTYLLNPSKELRSPPRGLAPHFVRRWNRCYPEKSHVFGPQRKKRGVPNWDRPISHKIH